MRSIPAKKKFDIGRIVVIGGNGKVGRLLRVAWDILGQGGLVWQSRSSIARPGWVHFDPLTEPGKFAAAVKGVDAIFNLAGVTSGDDDALSVNAQLALAAMEAARAASVPHVFLASSAAVYGRVAGIVGEEMELAPVTAYGRAKVDMEKAASDWRKMVGAACPDVCCLRFGNLAGADQLLGIDLATSPRPLDLFEDGTGPARTYIGPMTLARMLAELFERARHGTKLPFALNIGLSGAVRMDDLLRADGRGWVPRKATDSAIRSIELSIRQLAEHVSAPTLGAAEAIVEELRQVRGRIE